MKVHEVHVVAQQDIGGLEALHVDLLDFVLLPDHAHAAQGPEDGGKNFVLAQGRLGRVIALEAAIVDVDALHNILPPAGGAPPAVILYQFTIEGCGKQIRFLEILINPGWQRIFGGAADSRMKRGPGKAPGPLWVCAS